MGEDVPDTSSRRYKSQKRQVQTRGDGVVDNSERQTKPNLGGVVNGIPYGLDGYWEREPEGVNRTTLEVYNRKNRIKSLGNSVVPQVVYELLKAIQIHADTQ